MPTRSYLNGGSSKNTQGDGGFFFFDFVLTDHSEWDRPLPRNHTKSVQKVWESMTELSSEDGLSPPPVMIHPRPCKGVGVHVRNREVEWGERVETNLLWRRTKLDQPWRAPRLLLSIDPTIPRSREVIRVVNVKDFSRELGGRVDVEEQGPWVMDDMRWRRRYESSCLVPLESISSRSRSSVH